MAKTDAGRDMEKSKTEKVKAAMAASAGQKGADIEAVDSGEDDQGVADLPFSRGKTFTSLDEYLAHLKEGGAVDLPWWREVQPGVYEYVTNRTGAERKTATREELMERFGFAR